MTRHIYSLKYRRRDDPFGRVYRMTVQARNADEARAYAAIRDEKFGTTTESPKRRGEVDDTAAVQAAIDAANARGGGPAFVTVDGGRHGDIEVEVVD